MAPPGRIFLSHKTVDKTIVRDYKATLEMVGLRPWLDEDDLHAGVELHRALQKGMKDSCAAVFFITPAYQDEKFLRAEINYAIARVRDGAGDPLHENLAEKVGQDQRQWTQQTTIYPLTKPTPPRTP